MPVYTDFQVNRVIILFEYPKVIKKQTAKFEKLE